jgi:hypothetical protein
MSRYFFGTLFVRFAKIIAALVLLGGLGGAALRYAQGAVVATGLRYEPSASTGARLFALGREWQRTRQLVRQFLGQSAPTMTEVSFSNAPSSPAEFARLTAQLAKMQSERDLAKEAIVRRFESQVMEIERKLRAHAAELAGTPAPESKTTPEKSPEREPVNSAEPKTLFDSLKSAEVATRRNALAEGQEFISLLKNSAENPDNAATLAGALNELANLERFLPISLETAPKLAPRSEIPNVAAPPAPKLTAEKVADQLQQLRSQIRSALLTDWAIDRALVQTAAEVENEQRRCLEASRPLKALWMNVGTFMAVVIVCAVLASFFILVLADVVRATLDAAQNSALVAAAIQNPPAVDEKESAILSAGETDE